MAILPVRVFLLYNFLNALLLYLVPKRLREFLPPSWYPLQSSNLDDNAKEIPDSPLTSSSSSSSSPFETLKRMDSAELKRVFEMFDKNGDGRITEKELSDSLENLGILIPAKELTQMIEKIDEDGDGCLDIDEFGALYKTIMDEQGEEGDVREAFNVFDQNGDGFITVDELKSVLGSLGLTQGRTLEDCTKMIMQVDVDGDGRVNYREFRQMLNGGGFTALR